MGVVHLTSDKAVKGQNLMEILHERYLVMQTALETAWKVQSDLIISQTEWKIIGRIDQGVLPVAHITKNLHITRQATHKLIKNLSSKGLVELYQMENNKKERCIALTSLGRECYNIYKSIHAEIEQQIALNLGTKQIEDLNSIMQSDWGI